MSAIPVPTKLSVREVSAFAQTLASAVADASGQLSLDVSQMEECDALGFQLIESARIAAQAHGVDLTLHGPLHPRVAAVLARIGAEPATHSHWFNEVTA